MLYVREKRIKSNPNPYFLLGSHFAKYFKENSLFVIYCEETIQNLCDKKEKVFLLSIGFLKSRHYSISNVIKTLISNKS